MARIISVFNHKGGVGKTITAVNIGAFLAWAGKKTLLYDFDPEGCAAASLDMNARNYDLEAPLDADLLKKSCKATSYENLYFFWCHENYRKYQSCSQEDFSSFLRQIKFSYDYILFDLPPGQGEIHDQILKASHSVLIPVQCNAFSILALDRALKTVRRVGDERGEELLICGILPTMYNFNSKESKNSLAEIQNLCAPNTFKHYIPLSETASASLEKQRPLVDLALSSPLAYSYLEAVKEIMEKRDSYLFPQKKDDEDLQDDKDKEESPSNEKT